MKHLSLFFALWLFIANVLILNFFFIYFFFYIHLCFANAIMNHLVHYPIRISPETINYTNNPILEPVSLKPVQPTAQLVTQVTWLPIKNKKLNNWRKNWRLLGSLFVWMKLLWWVLVKIHFCKLLANYGCHSDNKY